MKTETELSGILDDLIGRLPQLAVCREDIEAAAHLLSDVFEGGGKLLACGNGGSAADAEHVVGELMKTFSRKRALDGAFAQEYERRFGSDPSDFLQGALCAISLASQTSLATAVMNDVDAESVFAQQVYGYGRAGDALLALSTSGESENVVRAAQVALARGMHVVSLTGQAESRLSRLADVAVRVPEVQACRVQELHLPVYHALCDALEAEFF